MQNFTLTLLLKLNIEQLKTNNTFNSTNTKICDALFYAKLFNSMFVTASFLKTMYYY